MPKNYTTQKLYIGLFVFFSLCVTQTVYGQNQKNLATTLEEFRAVLINPNDAALLRLTSKDLTYGHSNGLIENQDQFIEALKNGPSKFVAIQVSDQSITLVDDLALVRQNLSGDVQTGEAISKLNLGVLYVWVKDKGSWKLLARQAFKR
jgi:hypothetical protein